MAIVANYGGVHMALDIRHVDPIRLLVCDDYYLIREALKVVLGREPGMEVVAEAETGEEALRMVDDFLPDVVIMDILLPGLNGIQATRVIKQSHPSVAVVALTRYEDVEHIMEIYRSGASAYLGKGVKAEDLVRTIRAVYSGAVVLHPGVAAAVIQAFGRPSMAPLGSSQAGLSPREQDVLQLLAQSLSNKEIARELSISIRTAQNHIASIFRKLELDDRVSAAVYAISQGLAKPEKVVLRSPASGPR